MHVCQLYLFNFKLWDLVLPRDSAVCSIAVEWSTVWCNVTPNLEVIWWKDLNVFNFSLGCILVFFTCFTVGRRGEGFNNWDVLASSRFKEVVVTKEMEMGRWGEFCLAELPYLLAFRSIELPFIVCQHTLTLDTYESEHRGQVNCLFVYSERQER